MDASSYLDRLALSEDERHKLKGLAATSPYALASMMRAAPEDFARFLGHQRAEELAGALERLLSPAEKERLTRPVRPFRIGGAVIDRPAPVIPPPPYDINERNRLFNELQQLRDVRNPSPETRQRIQTLEQQLNELLEGSRRS